MDSFRVWAIADALNVPFQEMARGMEKWVAAARAAMVTRTASEAYGRAYSRSRALRAILIAAAETCAGPPKPSIEIIR